MITNLLVIKTTVTKPCVMIINVSKVLNANYLILLLETETVMIYIGIDYSCSSNIASQCWNTGNNVPTRNESPEQTLEKKSNIQWS